MLVSASTYTAVTGTAAPSNYADLEARVVARLSAVLGRPLQSAERVEKLTANFDGFAYPKARPVTAVEGDYDFDEHTIRIGQGSALVTYTGGWTDETVPADLAEAIAWGIPHRGVGGNRCRCRAAAGGHLVAQHRRRVPGVGGGRDGAGP
jgi:hypothetical protein